MTNSVLYVLCVFAVYLSVRDAALVKRCVHGKLRVEPPAKHRGAERSHESADSAQYRQHEPADAESDTTADNGRHGASLRFNDLSG